MILTQKHKCCPDYFSHKEHKEHEESQRNTKKGERRREIYIKETV